MLQPVWSPPRKSLTTFILTSAHPLPVSHCSQSMVVDFQPVAHCTACTSAQQTCHVNLGEVFLVCCFHSAHCLFVYAMITADSYLFRCIAHLVWVKTNKL